MDALDPVELIGYLASALIVLSLLMASVLRLRVINLVGAIVFTVYGALIGSWPVIVTNAAIVLINVTHLTVLLRRSLRDGYFEVVALDPRCPVLDRFVRHHADEITRFQPGFEGIRDDHLAWMVLHEAVPVGVVVAERHGDELLLELDHVTAEHRDFTPGEVLFGRSGAFTEAGADTVVSRADTDTHRRYLERMGFERDGELWRRRVGVPSSSA